MGRVKIAMEPINNDKKRKLTFNTRKQGLVKKARELATLCDVNVSMIIYTDDQETPIIFPQDPDQLNRLIDVYKRNRCMDMGRNNNYVLMDFFKDRKTKIEEELVKAKKKNVEAKYPSWFDFLDSFPEARLREFALRLENKVFDVKSRIESVRNNNVDQCNSSVVNPVGVENNMIMQMWNPNLVHPIMRPVMMPSLYPNSMMNMLLNEDGDVGYDGDNFSVEPQLMEHCFAPELWQQFLMSDFHSRVNGSRANGTGSITYFK